MFGEVTNESYGKMYPLHRAKMSRQLKELNDMLAVKEQMMSECVTMEQKRESLKRQLTFEKKVHNTLSSTHDTLSSTHNTLSSTHNTLSSTHNTLSSTPNTLSSTPNTLSSTHNTLSSIQLCTYSIPALSMYFCVTVHLL